MRAPPRRGSKGQRPEPHSQGPTTARADQSVFVPFEQRRRSGDRAAARVELVCCRDELQDDGRGGGGGVRGVVVRLLGRRVGRRGGPVPGQRGRPPPVRAAAGAAEADELGQHLRHVRHDGAPPRQEGVVGVLPGQVAVVRVHGGGAVPGGPAEEGEAARARAQDEALQELRRAGGHGHGQEAAGLLLRQPRPHGRRQQLHEHPRQRGLLPPVGSGFISRFIRPLETFFIFFSVSALLLLVLPREL